MSDENKTTTPADDTLLEVVSVLLSNSPGDGGYPYGPTRTLVARLMARINQDRQEADEYQRRWHEARRAENALAELVYLKTLKDSHGKTPEYLELQPEAWAEAIRLVGPNPA
jgi:hypothetical protein